MLDANISPHILLDMTHSGVASNVIKRFGVAMSICTVSTSFGGKNSLELWKNAKENLQNCLLTVIPPTSIIPEIIRKIIIYQELKNAAIIFDNTFILDYKYNSLLVNVMCCHKIIPIKDTNIIEQLKNLQKQDVTNYFILGSTQIIKKILKAAEKIGLFEFQYLWYVITYEQTNFKSLCNNCTFVFIRPIINNTYLNFIFAEQHINTFFYFELITRSLISVRNTMEPKERINASFTKCTEHVGNTALTRNGTNLMRHIIEDIPGLPTFGKLQKTANGMSFTDFTMNLSVVKTENGLLKVPINLGYWKAGFDSELTITNLNIMKNLTPVVVYRVATVIQEPFVFINKSSLKGFSGYSVDFIDALANINKFDYKISLVSDRKFGDLDENGNWDGVVKELVEKRADIGLGSMWISAERENAVDFTIPYFGFVGYSILMKRPKQETFLFQFLYVLENQVWFCIFAAYFFTSCILWIFTRWSPYSYQNNHEKCESDKKREFNLKECLWFCMMSLTPQGGGEAPKHFSGRLVVAMWWLFVFIITASYTANLSAFLTVSLLEMPIESLDDLSKQYKIQYAPLNGSPTMIYFQRMADIEEKLYEVWKDMSLNTNLSNFERAKFAVWDYPLSEKYTKLWQAMKNAGLPNTLNEAVERVRSSNSSEDGFAFVGDASDIRFLQLTNCDLQMIGKEFSRKPYALAVQKESPLKERLNRGILHILNENEGYVLKRKWWRANPKAKHCNTENRSDAIVFGNVWGVFIVLLVGIGLSCIIITFEYCWYMHKKRAIVIFVEEIRWKSE